MKYGFVFFLAFLSVGCGGSSESNETAPPPINPSSSLITKYSSSTLPIPNNTDVESFEILFIGNSHVSSYDLPGIVKKLFETNLPDKSILSEKVNSSQFLANRINDGLTLETIKSRKWSHVILQAQKLSSSQSRYYPTEAAQTWVEVVKDEALATPILFAEHPQRGNETEARYIQAIYQGIADKKPSCIAPIGLAWDKATLIYPGLKLHAPDGNHASLTGTFLTALVLFQSITNQSVENSKFIEEIGIEQTVQAQLGQIAAQTIAETPACPDF